MVNGLHLYSTFSHLAGSQSALQLLLIYKPMTAAGLDKFRTYGEYTE